MLIVDRIEGSIVVVEFGSLFLNLPLSACPPNVKEGDVLCIELDTVSTLGRYASNESKLTKLFNK